MSDARPSPLALLTVGLFMLTGCAAQGAPDTASSTREPFGDVGIEVTNLNYLDANLYVLSGSNRLRVGMIRSNEVETFTFAYPGPDVQIEISFIGGGSFLSDRVMVEPGDVLQLTIDPTLDRKTWLRRP